MKLRDKETGAILDDCKISLKNKWGAMAYDQPGTLKELVERFEDVEETKEYWYIDYDGGILCGESDNSSAEKMMISMGNHFSSIEEAEKAVEKLKAWKRLKEANIDYKLSREYDDFTETMHANLSFSFNSYPLVGKDLWLLFGREE